MHPTPRPPKALTPNGAAVARALLRGTEHGFAIHEATGLPTTSVYLALARMQEWGWATSAVRGSDRGGRPCRVYTLTDTGREHVQRSLEMTAENAR